MHSFLSIRLIVVIIVGTIAPFQTVQAAGPFTMAFFQAPRNEPLLRYAELVYTDAFRRLGMEFRYNVYPGRRCGIMANNGEVDGEPGRTRSYNQDFPNLIRIEEPIIDIKMVAFAVDSTLCLNGWDSLRNTPYTLETILGNTFVEANLSRIVGAENFSKVVQIEQALKKLHAGRIDIFIHEETLVLNVLKKEDFKDFGIVNVGVMQNLSAYPFLHKKHTGLAEKLTDVLQKMKNEGTLEQYYLQSYEKE